MAELKRLNPEEVYTNVKAGRSLLICAYDDDEKFKKVHLEGAISLGEFGSRLSSLKKDQELVFYCA
jgi:hypothetical protein